jgi:hypothetical protein
MAGACLYPLTQDEKLNETADGLLVEIVAGRKRKK